MTVIVQGQVLVALFKLGNGVAGLLEQLYIKLDAKLHYANTTLEVSLNLQDLLEAVVLEAVQRSGFAFEYATIEIKNNETVVMAAV